MTTRDLVIKTSLTDAELAAKIGVAERTIARWRGRNTAPASMSLRKALARFAGVDWRKVDWTN